MSAEWGVCSSVCGIVMGEQNKTVSILQNAKVPARSVRESSVLAVSWKHGNTASALAAGLSQAHLALGYQPHQSSLWSLLPCSTHTPCSPSPYLDWGSVEMCSPLPLGCCTCVSSPSPLLLRQKKKGCGTMEGLLSFLCFGVASSQLWSESLQIPLECFWLCGPVKQETFQILWGRKKT